MTKGKIFGSFLKAGFNLDKMSAKLIAQMDTELSVADVATTTRSTAGSQNAPPGLKPIGVLGEVLVHAGDISLAVVTPLVLPVEHYVIGLDHMKTQQSVLGCKRRIEGLQLNATDVEWSTGEGPAVEGTARNLLLAMTGRKSVLGQLSGDGAATLRSR